MATMQTSNFSDLVTRGFRQILVDEWPKLELQYKKIINVEQADQLSPKESRVSPFATAVTKAETVAATEKTFAQMYDIAYTLYSYSIYYKLSRELKDNDLYDVIPKAPRMLKDSHRDAMEVTVANIYNNAFTSGVGGDSKYLCASDHPLVTGTASNTVNADLSLATLEAAMIAMRGTVDDQNKKIKMVPRKLLVPKELGPTAHKLIKSVLDPETANNASNWVNAQQLEIIENDYLTDVDSWFLLADKHFVKMFIGKGTTEEPELIVQATTDMTLDTIYQTYNRFGAGWTDWRGVYGAKGV
ncbi:MAG: Mu-like prophage major head subunit gpT family protein [Janthinobacterium sp.]|jgi:hypothetical protein